MLNVVLCLNVNHPVLQAARACVQLWAPRGEALHLPLLSPFLLALLSHSWCFSVWLSARGKQHFSLLYFGERKASTGGYQGPAVETAELSRALPLCFGQGLRRPLGLTTAGLTSTFALGEVSALGN